MMFKEKLERVLMCNCMYAHNYCIPFIHFRQAFGVGSFADDTTPTQRTDD